MRNDQFNELRKAAYPDAARDNQQIGIAEIAARQLERRIADVRQSHAEHIGSSSVLAQQMAITRDVLNRSERERQRAVCTFPLVVASLANNMRKILEIVEENGESKESREYLQYAEDVIREEYRKHFGRELGQ